jgi:hypothetical protein
VIPVAAQINAGDWKVAADLRQARAGDLIAGELVTQPRTTPDQPLNAQPIQPLDRHLIPSPQQGLDMAEQRGGMNRDEAKDPLVNFAHDATR